MNVEPVDERDSGWEDPAPRFRVYLFAGDEPGYTTWPYDISGGHGLGGSGACPTPRRSCLGCLALVPDVGRASEAGLDVGRDATDTDRDGGIHSRRSGRRAYSWSRKRRVGA